MRTEARGGEPSWVGLQRIILQLCMCSYTGRVETRSRYLCRRKAAAAAAAECGRRPRPPLSFPLPAAALRPGIVWSLFFFFFFEIHGSRSGRGSLGAGLPGTRAGGRRLDDASGGRSRPQAAAVPVHVPLVKAEGNT